MRPFGKSASLVTLKFQTFTRIVKKFLIITYYWPPAGGAGVMRWAKMTKYISQYGWSPVVYTPADGETDRKSVV